MRKAIAMLLLLALPSVASAGVIGMDKFSLVGGLGTSIAVNSSEFQSDFKEGVTWSLRGEFRVLPSFAVYGDYANVSFDPMEAVNGDIQISSAAVGGIFFGNLNTFGTVQAFIDVGVVSNTVHEGDTEFKLRPGGGVDIAASSQVGIRPSVYISRYAGQPDFVDGLELKLALRLTPFAQ